MGYLKLLIFKLVNLQSNSHVDNGIMDYILDRKHNDLEDLNASESQAFQHRNHHNDMVYILE